MASIPENLICSICQEVFKHPVVLTCNHSFCRGCLKTCWKEKPGAECPACRRRFSKEEPPIDMSLQRQCETFLQQRASEGFCQLHSESLDLFCLDHQQPVCPVCRGSHQHAGHTFSPIQEAAQQHRKELQETLEPLRRKLELRRKVQEEFSQTAEHMKVQARSTERQIRDQFQKLHQFLLEEEEARLASLREEEEQKSRMMKEKMEALSREIAALSDTVRSTEEQLSAGDISFLRCYQAAAQQVDQHPLLEEPQLPSGALIDQAKHLGNLTFNIWSSMKDLVSYTPLVLDPNSAHPELLLSEDLTTLRRGEKQPLPQNPERIGSYSSVLSSQGFCSGSHSWEVEVGGSTYWLLGLMPESVHKTGDTQSGFWRIGFYGGSYSALDPAGSANILPVQRKVQKVQVNLDWEAGKLTFSDPDTDTHIHTFTHTFTEKVMAFIMNVDQNPVRVLPGKISINLSI
ncbi:PREDICTED: tripartite motif-containing protein 35-like [Cyprinodon variegatus]|uniref:tripartite motif-containing protein 35-like n=1 Tax=Cyprinodon variegatus TaxID=28743 RepID=UPI0007429C4C|nr:PREDICTED: tripartite motif-containing protein 35-like [Cyprinodon variegatus]